MKKAEIKQLAYFPKELDAAINKRFPGADAVSEYDFFGSGNYITTFKGEGEVKKNIECFIYGYLAGNSELGKRLLNPELYIL